MCGRFVNNCRTGCCSSVHPGGKLKSDRKCLTCPSRKVFCCNLLVRPDCVRVEMMVVILGS